MTDVAALVGNVGRLQDDAVRRGLESLEQVRKNLAGQIASTEWGAQSLDSLKQAVAASMDSFSAQYSDVLSQMGIEAWDEGIASVTSPANLPGLSAASPAISTTNLSIMQGYSADLITNLSADAIKKINTELMMGVLGGQTLDDVMTKIGRNLTDPGVFRDIAVRAETIARTELANINSNARQARINSLSDNFKRNYPGVQLYKEWIHSGKRNARKNHAALNGKIVKLEDDFPGGIPYPHAPGLPAREVVNCGCVHRVLFPGMRGYPDADKYKISDGEIIKVS